MTPHKHAEVIKAWAEGKQIQFKVLGSDGDWLDSIGPENPSWSDRLEYRIKPEAPKYPQTRTSPLQRREVINKRLSQGLHSPMSREGYDDATKEIFDLAISRACEDGDVVPASTLQSIRDQSNMRAAELVRDFDSMLEKVAKAVQATCRAEHILKWNLVDSDIAMKGIDLKAIIASVKEEKE